jgi:predicted nucleic-acid-binding protein
MIGLDTDVLVGYIMQDDAKQASLATRLIESLSPEAGLQLGAATQGAREAT